MLRKSQLPELTPTELLLLQKHIQLGKEHLHRVLTPSEVGQIFSLAEAPEGVRDELVIDKAELAGTASVVFNTFMSAILGAWVGLSEFLQFDLYRIGLVIAVLVGGWIGFQNSRSRKRKADEAIEKRKLQDVELSLIAEINRKRKIEIQEKKQEVFELGVQEWERFLDPKKEHQTFSPILKKLSQKSARMPLTFTSWLRANYRDLFIDVVPTLFGGLSSLFLYLNGEPILPEEPLKIVGVDLLFNPEVQLLTSLAITLYFAITFIHLNRKAFLRDQELEKEEVYITREEDQMTLLDDELLKLKEALFNIKKSKDQL